MSHRRWGMIACVAGGLGLLGAIDVSAQEARQKTDVMTLRMQANLAFYDGLPAPTRAGLSSGAQTLFHVARHWEQAGQLLRLGPSGASAPTPLALTAALPAGRVSDPAKDLNGKGTLYGFTQNGTHTAWCDKTLVVGFTDTGSLVETEALGGGLSLNGYSVSTDGGLTFHDQGYVPAGAATTNFLYGDPVMGCGPAGTFYQASLFEFNDGQDETGVSVSQSTDGGQTFGAPVVVAKKPLNNANGTQNFLDKEWLAVDPTTPANLYVTYTDFDNSGTDCTTLIVTPTTTYTTFVPGSHIMLATSVNSGANWSTVEIDRACDYSFAGAFVQGSQVVVDDSGNYYVAWAFNRGGVAGEMRFAKNPVGALGPPFPYTVVTSVVPPGGYGVGLFQGNVRNSISPSLAVDRSAKLTKGYLYLTWNDGRRNGTSDRFFDYYSFSDVFVLRSTDGGATWPRFPVRVNTNLEPTLLNPGTDQYMPSVTVDKYGYVGMCWYDRRADLYNFKVDRFCGKSVNGGVSFSNLRKNLLTSPATVCGDAFVPCSYLGDYDGVATDFLKINVGFRGAYGDNTLGNPDVKMTPVF